MGMTREEKIKGLYSLKEYLVGNPIELKGHKSLPITLIDYAIESLEQEPKTDTWSLDDARENFMSDVYNTLDFLPTNNEANRIIDSFDRVTSGIKQEPKTEWIPVSERLPDEDGEYCVTIYDMDENYKYRDIAELEDGIWQYKSYIKVLAWMPLPTPYEPQESEDKE